MKKKEVTVYAPSLKRAVNELKDTLNVDSYSEEPEGRGENLKLIYRRSAR